MKEWQINSLLRDVRELQEIVLDPAGMGAEQVRVALQRISYILENLISDARPS